MPKVSKQAAFLAAFALTASITKAAECAGVDRVLHYRWLKEIDGYPALWADAQTEAAQTLEDEAIRRAHEGVAKPVIYQGELCFPWLEKIDPETGEVTRKRADEPLAIREYSDNLMMFLLKAHNPDRFRDNSKVELTGANGGPIEIVERLNAARRRMAELKSTKDAV